MQRREVEQFDRVFADYPGAPQGEPTDQDLAALKAAIRRHRNAKQTLPTA